MRHSGINGQPQPPVAVWNDDNLQTGCFATETNFESKFGSEGAKGSGAQVKATIGSGPLRGVVCVRGAARSHVDAIAWNAPTAFMPAAARSHCILRARDLENAGV